MTPRSHGQSSIAGIRSAYYMARVTVALVIGSLNRKDTAEEQGGPMKAIVLSMVLSVGFLVVSVVAMRRQRLREQAALLWLSVSLVMVFVSATLPIHLLDRVSHFVGIAYPPDLVLLLAVLFLMVLVFHLSLSLARLSAKQTALVQEIGLMTTMTPIGDTGPTTPSRPTSDRGEARRRSPPDGSQEAGDQAVEDVVLRHQARVAGRRRP